MSDDKEVMKGVSKKLGIPPLVVEDENSSIQISTNPSDFKMLPISAEDQKTEQDFEFARQNIMKLMNDGQQALAHLLRVAKVKEEARTYEVVATLIKNLGEVGTRLLELHDQRRAILPVLPEPEPEEPVQPNNGEFVGTPAELLRLVIQERQKIQHEYQIEPKQERSNSDQENREIPDAGSST